MAADCQVDFSAGKCDFLCNLSARRTRTDNENCSRGKLTKILVSARVHLK